MVMRLTTSQAAELTDGFHIEEGTMNLVQALYLNNAVEPFNNEKVRQALCYAINPQEIMDIVADGKGERVGTSMYPGLKKYFDKDLNDYYTQDYDKAKELLKEAGYEDGFDMEITVCSADQPHMDAAQVIVEELKEIGVNATIKPVEWQTWLSEAYMNRNFQSTVVGVDAANLTARAMLERFVSDADNNFINFNDPEYDETFAKAIATTDDKEQVKLYKDCEKILTEKAGKCIHPGSGKSGSNPATDMTDTYSIRCTYRICQRFIKHQIIKKNVKHPTDQWSDGNGFQK